MLQKLKMQTTQKVNGYIDKKFSEKTFLGQPKSMVLMKSKGVNPIFE